MADVLVVDDEPTTCRTLERLLRSEGYDAQCISDGRAALAALRAAPPPRVVILDLMMPGVTGWDVLRALRAEPPGAGVSVVVYSALDYDATAAAARSAGAVGYVVKGWGWEPLRAELAKHLRP